VREDKKQRKTGELGEYIKTRGRLRREGKNKIGRRLIEKNVGWVFIHIAVTKA